VVAEFAIVARRDDEQHVPLGREPVHRRLKKILLRRIGAAKAEVDDAGALVH
jgi:hypothetical protein